MPGLSEIIDRLTRLSGIPQRNDDRGPGKLVDLSSFGSNRGALRAQHYVPDGLRPSAALVVVLHGCTQTAAGYDQGTGWSDLADRHGFALLLPEQQRANNANLCFNWFDPEDSRRGSGEVLSIRQMIAAMVERHDVDPARVFVTGLSAGGAMTSALLATYPEVFAGGAIIAGLPYGCASTVPQALERMRGRGGPNATELAALVRDASDHRGPWPTISVWHGSGDATVNPSNGDAIVSQWQSLHGVSREPSWIEAVDGYPRSVWCDGEGREVIEAYSVTGLGHGTPLDTFAEGGCGTSGAFMLEAGISSSQHICKFWGLIHARSPGAVGRPASSPPRTSGHAAAASRTGDLRPPNGGPSGAVGDGKVIEDALRAAGLVR